MLFFPQINAAEYDPTEREGWSLKKSKEKHTISRKQMVLLGQLKKFQFDNKGRFGDDNITEVQKGTSPD